MSIRTRFAPSPTGYLHVGGARTALFSWLHARKHGGRFILRIEDTDIERSSIDSVNAILEGMTWLGLEYDEGPIYQTERFDRYKEVIRQLLESGDAYRCYCTKEELEQMRAEQMGRKEKPRYNGRCRPGAESREGVSPVIRFRNPVEGAVIVDDLVRGKIVFNNGELDDLIIARSDGTPTYNLTVVVDDLDMGVTHVIRGDDHINNTPRQINILKALGAEPPQYAHVPMILGDDGKRLSKRHGAVSVMQYREEGFLPEALLNYLVRLGWSHGDRELFSLDEMIALFDIKDVNKAASTLNSEKLLWLNHQYIMNSEPEHVAHHLSYQMGKLDIDPVDGPEQAEVVKVQRERTKTLVEMAQNSAFFYRDFDSYDEKAARKNLKPAAVEPLTDMLNNFKALPDWSSEAIHKVVVETAELRELKLGKVAQPLRVAVAGGPVSPPIDITLELLGRERTIQRIERAIAWIETQST